MMPKDANRDKAPPQGQPRLRVGWSPALAGEGYKVRRARAPHLSWTLRIPRWSMSRAQAGGVQAMADPSCQARAAVNPALRALPGGKDAPPHHGCALAPLCLSLSYLVTAQVFLLEIIKRCLHGARARGSSPDQLRGEDSTPRTRGPGASPLVGRVREVIQNLG